MPKLSIIVPIYNVERWLPRCLDSILNQKYSDFELILINDGSPDGCQKIIDKYAEKDNRIVAIQQENRGVSAARNSGLRISKGEYIGFVDPDDWIDVHMYEKLVEAIEQDDSDIACCSWFIADEKGNIEEHCIDGLSEHMTGVEFAAHLFDRPRTVGGTNCNKLFKRSIVRHDYDETLTICEDNLFLSQCTPYIKRAVLVRESLYFIFERSNSAIRKNPKRVVLGLPVREDIIEVVSELGSYVQNCAEADFLDGCLGWLETLNSDSEYYFVAQNAFCSYVNKKLFEIIKNPIISWKLKVIYLKTWWKAKKRRL